MAATLAGALVVVGSVAQLTIGAGQAVAAPAPERVVDDGARVIDFNRDWTFHLATRTPTVVDNTTLALADAGEVTTAEAIDPAFDDSEWRTVRLPHDFSIEGDKVPESTNSQAYLQGGLGWYRKSFSVPESFQAQGKRVTIDFEGVYQNSVVYLNGEEVGTYPNGYTGFAYDLTERLNYGDTATNVLVVKVQNPAPSGRWYTGSGIVRPVNLVVTDPVRIVRNGLTLTSPNLEATYAADGSGVLDVDAEVFSDATNGVLHTRTSVIAADGTVAAVAQGEPVETNPSTLTQLEQSVRVPDVQLWYPWNLGDPYLYTVRTELFYLGNGTVDTRLVDTVEQRYGFRWFRVDNGDPADPNAGGLYVNGEYTKIDGVDLHHDSGALGAAAYRDAYERQWDVLKSMGVNAYRTSHNPPAKSAIEVASEKGIIVVEEAYDGWGAAKATYDFGRFFLQPVPQDWAGLQPNGLLNTPRPGVDYEGAQYLWSDWVIQEMTARDRNEASLFMWSIGNEVRGVGPRPSWYDPAQYDALGDGVTAYNEYTEAVRLAEAIKDVDDTRPIVQGGDQERRVPAQDSTYGRINRYLDGFGLNYNTATSVDGLIDQFHETTFFFESESSSQTSSRGVYLDPTLRNTGINQTPGKRGGSNYDNDFASWTMSNEYGLKKDRDRKAFLGQFIWSGFDYLGEPTPYSVYPVGVSSFGAIDTAGFPKDSYYLFRSQWVDAEQEPSVHVLPGNWNQWKEGQPVEVWVNANVPSVELFLNGESLGRKTFDVKQTAYGKQYLETSELTGDDKTWPTPNGNTGGYSSPGATVVTASGDSEIPAGTNYGKLHLTWDVPFQEGVLEARAYASDTATEPVATDAVATAGSPYTVRLESNKDVLAADGESLAYIEATVVDEAGNEVPDAENLLEFDVTGGAIVGVDNGRQESTEPYKWGGVERNVHSQRSAYAGKALAIVQSNEGQTGPVQVVVRSAGMQPAVLTLAATADGTGTAPGPVTLTPQVAAVQDLTLAVPAGPTPTLPRDVRVTYTDPTVGSYDVVRRATWSALDPADFAEPGDVTVTGTVEGVDLPVRAFVSVVAPTGEGEIAVNPALGTNNEVFSFDGLAADSPLRAGALATATFTGSTTAYPNNVLNGNPAEFWTNAYSRGASVLLPASTQSRPFEELELFWDGLQTFDTVSLAFTQSETHAVPADLDVEYWDGLAWQDVTGLEVAAATESDAPTTLTFDSVLTDRVRVGMTNATPYTATGNIRVTAAGVTGLQIPVAVVTSGLRAAVDEARALTEGDWTPASWAVLGTALETAEAVLADADATAQEVSAATQGLRDAVAALVALPDDWDDPSLSALTVGGAAVAGFDPAVLEYTVELPAGTTVVPTVTATAAAGESASVVVTQATTVPGTATVTVTAADGETTRTYTVRLTRTEVPATPVTPAPVTFADAEGTADDTFTVPSTTGVEYVVGDEVVAAGTYPGVGSVVVVARATAGFVLAAGATSQWAYTFDSSTTPEPTEPSFTDVPRTSPFFAPIEWLDASGIASGYADGTFQPVAPVSRQAMAAFLYRMAGSPDFTAPRTATFPDVPTSSRFFAEVEWLVAQKVTGGYTDGLFRPTAPVSRQAMASFLYRVAGEPDEGASQVRFTDVPADSAFATPISWMWTAGISEGYQDGSFQPAVAVTRQAMAAFLQRYSEAVGE